MSNIIKEIEQSINEVPPLKIDIRPVMQTAPAPDPLSGVKPVSLPEAVPQPLQAPQPSAPVQPIPSTGSPIPEVPQVDALSYGDTISRMSAQSASDIQKTLAATGTPKPNDVQKNLLNSSTPVQIDPSLSSQANPFAGNKPENAQERLAFEPPVLANGLANPFSDPDARAAVAAGISKEEYIAYIRDVRAKGDEATSFGTPITPSTGYTDEYGQTQGVTSNTSGSFTGLSADQIRRKMSERGGYLSARRNFNTSFLPFAGSENRSELETLFAALSFPANLVKGIGLDATQLVAAVASGTKLTNVNGSFIPLPNLEQIAKDYEAMRPTRGGTFTGAAVLGEQFSSMAQVDEAGNSFNPLAVVRDDKNIWQVGLGFGLDLIADPLNNDKLASTLFRPLGLFQKPKLPDVPVAAASSISREIIPVVTEKYRQSPRLVTTVGDTPTIRPQPDRVPTPNTPPRVGVTEAPQQIVIEREVARTNELAVYKPTERVFPEAKQPYIALPESRTVVSAPEVNMYNNVTALFNDSKELTVVQRFMRDVVEQKPFEQIPDAHSLTVVQNPVLREVVEFAKTGDLTPNIAVLQGAKVDDIAAIVADKLELVRDTPMVVPKIVAQPIEVPKLDYSITSQLPKIEVPKRSAAVALEPSKVISTEFTSTPVSISKPVVVSEAPFTSLSDFVNDARDGSVQSLSEVRNWSQKGDFNTKLKDVPNAVDDLGIDALDIPTLVKVVKGRAGKLKADDVANVADSLNRVNTLGERGDIAKSLLDGLWRKATDEQRQEILKIIKPDRLNKLGFERVETKVIPPTLPTLSHVRASTIDEGVTSGYHIVNDSQTPIESLRVAALREQGLSARESSSMKVHPISDEISVTGAVSDASLESLLKSRELSAASVAERNWSSKMLQQIWDVATPQQKARIMSEIDAKTLERLGFERIARSNVIDDHLPPEVPFDTPC